MALRFGDLALRFGAGRVGRLTFQRGGPGVFKIVDIDMEGLGL